MTHPRVLALLGLCVLAATQTIAQTAGTLPTEELGGLDWRFVGPQGNRVSAVVCDRTIPTFTLPALAQEGYGNPRTAGRTGAPSSTNKHPNP